MIMNVRSILRGSPPDLHPAPDPYLCCNFFDLNLGPTPSPATVPSMSHLRSCGRSIQDPDPAPDSYLHCNLWGSTPSPAPVPSMSHLRSCGRSIPDPDPDPYLCCTFWGSTPSLALVTSMCHIRSCGETVLSTNNPMVFFSKLNISSHISVYLNIICSIFT